METVYYTVYARAKASGGENRVYTTVMTPAPRKLPPLRNNVISLDDYRTRPVKEEADVSSFARGDGCSRPSTQIPCSVHTQAKEDPGACMPPAPRFAILPRRRPADVLLWGMELLACAALIAVAAACVVFLL